MNSLSDELREHKNSMDPTGPAVNTAGTNAVVATDYVYKPLTTKHRRAGSTGTTGDEEYTTDEEELYADEVECTGGASHPILKSDLARAATDLFGYEAKGDCDADEDEDNDEGSTGLFDEDEKKYTSRKSTISPFGNNDESVPNREKGLAHLKSTNPFYASLKNASGSSSLSSNEGHPEFQMCKRPAELKLPTSATESLESSIRPESLSLDSDPTPTIPIVTIERNTRYENPETSTNPFCVSFSGENEGRDTPVPAVRLSITGSDVVDEGIRSVEEEVDDRCSPGTGGVISEGLSMETPVQWGRTLAEVKEQAVTKLQDELRRAHEELKLKAEEVTRLSRIRQDVETELEDLTASLFQEAHRMVKEANVRQATAEKLLAESRMKSEVLAAEVAALKTLVLTSTPARPNPHLHPQIDARGRDETPGGLFAKRHRRSPSHFNLKYGRENSPPESPVKEQRASLPTETTECRDSRDGLEVDPIVHKEFLQWKANPCVDRADPFVKRIFKEDIDLCLDFANKELGAKVRQAVLDGIVFVEAVSDKTKVAFPK
ncbi:uncharacterized protein LOC105691292 isoform X2 [Athalia rosae]|nr:uncharacterized protein LOC105691292 isoform X2 [Athalia rosae]